MDEAAEILRRLAECGLPVSLSWDDRGWHWAIGEGEWAIAGESDTIEMALCCLGEVGFSNFPTTDFAAWWKVRRSAEAVG